MTKDFSEFREQYLTVEALEARIDALPDQSKTINQISELPNKLLSMSFILSVSLLEDYHNRINQQDQADQ